MVEMRVHFEFRERPPPEFDNPEIPTERYKKMREEGNLGLARTINDDLVYNM